MEQKFIAERQEIKSRSGFRDDGIGDESGKFIKKLFFLFSVLLLLSPVKVIFLETKPNR